MSELINLDGLRTFKSESDKRYFRKISTEEGNVLVIKDDGLFVPTVDVSNFITKDMLSDKLQYKVVTKLPTENISNSTIYMLQDSDDDNTYDMWMYLEEKWIGLGNTELMLADYALKSDVDELKLKAHTHRELDTLERFFSAEDGFYYLLDEGAFEYRDYTYIATAYGLCTATTAKGSGGDGWIVINGVYTYKWNGTPETFHFFVKPGDRIQGASSYGGLGSCNIKKIIRFQLDETSGSIKVVPTISKDEGNVLSVGSDGGMYAHGRGISEDEGNILTVGEDDGYYVPGFKDELESVSKRIDNINIAQKTVNKGSEYLSATLAKSSTSISAGNYVLPYLTYESHGVDVSDNNHIVLEAGKTYYLVGNVDSSNGTSETMYSWFDITHGVNIGSQGTDRIKVDFKNSAYCIIKPETTIEVDVKILSGSSQIYANGRYTSLFVYTIDSITIDPVDYVNDTQGIEGDSVGFIKPYLGKIAPKHTLACDGAIYNIVDYPHLSQWIKEQYGKYNQFGGDGVDTFAVPDLRGEFLRGSGENGHENQGNGGEVGEHQDGTTSPYVTAWAPSTWNAISIGNVQNSSDNMMPTNTDITTIANNYTYVTSNISKNTPQPSYYTSRPTNTSVLWCIVYEPTYCMELNQNAYMGIYHPELTEEHLTGETFNGKPVYSLLIKGISGTAINNWNNLYDLSKHNPDTIISLNGIVDNYMQIAWWASSTYHQHLGYNGGYICEQHGIAAYNNKNIICEIKYTKTTDTSFDISMIFDQYSTEQLVELPVTDEEINECLKGV